MQISGPQATSVNDAFLGTSSLSGQTAPRQGRKLRTASRRKAGEGVSARRRLVTDCHRCCGSSSLAPDTWSNRPGMPVSNARRTNLRAPLHWYEPSAFLVPVSHNTSRHRKVVDMHIHLPAKQAAPLISAEPPQSTPAYAAAIAFVALTGSFNTLHKALKFSVRGRQ